MKAFLRFAAQHERMLILLFCAIAAVRVFTLSAAFPFFNNVDEQAHVDLVMKYARGHVPRDLGQDSLLSPTRRLPLRVLLFGGIVLFIVVSEIILSWPAFSSHYNLFHFNKAQ